jgi:hypothetical protein
MNSFKINPLKRSLTFPFICWIIVVLVHISWNAIGQDKLYKNGLGMEISYVSNQNALKNRNFKNDPGLNYPTSVERFYKEKGYQLQWVDKGHPNCKLFLQ